MPLGSEPRAQRLIRRTRTGPESYTQDDLEWVAFVPLIGEQGWPER
jgi:protein-L-isoaspartate(D-aspartate) O-methyltransferase